MTTPTHNTDEPCVGYRQVIQDRLDDGPEASADRSLEDHLAGCDACRAFQNDLRVLRSALLNLPLTRLPSYLADADRYTQPRSGKRRVWRRVGASIAAVVVFGLAGLWWAQHEVNDELPLLDAAQTWQDLERVMSLTGKALHDVQLVALREAVADPLAAAAQSVRAYGVSGNSVP